ncbi:MAG: hypothetical protein WBQ89_11870, partial [Candidatus Acidiferrum sp.]
MPEPNPASSKSPAAEQLRARLESLLVGRNSDPFGILGPHPLDSPEGRRWAIRFFLPRASGAQILLRGLPSETLP